MRYDVKALIGSYAKATRQADDLLFSAGSLAFLSESASSASVGKRLPTALYVHNISLERLPAVLRVYEGCARWLIGDIGSANVVKLATDKPKVSYLWYPRFDTDPHPALMHAMYVRLRDLDVGSRSYVDSVNPPILHRKEELVPEGYPRRSTFARLTRQEERFGLLTSDTRMIGNILGWNSRLEERGVYLRGHRVIRQRSQGS
jgi:DNA phosphorothioation-associated putative methyltransferase